MWEDNLAVVKWLDEEMTKPANESVIKQNCFCVKQDYNMQQIKRQVLTADINHVVWAQYC